MGCHNSRRISTLDKARTRDSTPEEGRRKPLMDETPPQHTKREIILVADDDEDEDSGDSPAYVTEDASDDNIARAASAPPKIVAPVREGAQIPMGLCKNAGTTAGGRWSEPSAKTFKVRSRNYLKNKRKANSDETLFRLVHLDIFQTKEGCISHIADAKSSWYNQYSHVLPRPHFALIINMQVRSLNCNIVSYHLLDKGLESVQHQGLRDMLKHMATKGDNKWCNNRLKMIPRIVEAPFIVRMAVSSRPVLIGRKVQCKYYRGETYLEVDCNVDSSSVSATAVKLAHKWSECIVVDIVWLLEAQDAKELPERILAGIRLDKVAFAKAQRFRAKTFTEEKQRAVNSQPTSPMLHPAAPLATRETGVAASAPSLSPAMTPRVHVGKWDAQGTPRKRLDSNIDYTSVEDWLRDVGLLEGLNKTRLSIPELREVMITKEKEIEKMEESGRSSPDIIDRRRAFLTWEMGDQKLITPSRPGSSSAKAPGGRSSRAESSDLPRRTSPTATQKRPRRTASRSSMRIHSESSCREYIGKAQSPMSNHHRRRSNPMKVEL